MICASIVLERFVSTRYIGTIGLGTVSNGWKHYSRIKIGALL